MNRKHMIPLLCTFLCWGSVYVISKSAMRYIPPVTLLMMRYLVSVPALLLLLLLRGALRPVAREDIPTILSIGLLGYFLSFCLQMLGMARLTGSLSSLLGAMNPLFIPVLAALFLKERITARKVLCVAVSMLGVVLIIGVRGTADPIGAALLLVSVLLWSTSSIIIRRLAGRYDPMQMAMMSMLAALPLTFLWSRAELRSAACVLNAESLLSVLAMGIIGTTIAHSCWNYSLARMDASFCSMFYPLQPLTATVLGVLFLHEAVTPNFIIGGLIICCGIVLTVTGEAKQRTN